MAEIISNKIESGEYTLSNKRNGRSVIWDILREIKKDDGSILNGQVFCTSCSKVLKFNGSQTTNMLRHKCVISMSKEEEVKKVDREHKDQAIEICTKWVVQDCRPFSAVEGTGFKNVVKFFIKMGAKYGENIDIDDLIPSAPTISNQITTMANKKKREIKMDLKEVINSRKASITTDLWSDHYVKRQFLCATLHFEHDLKLKEMVLGVKSMDFERATGENIRSKLRNLLAEFGIDDMGKLIFVTDRGSNIKLALSDFTRLNCSNHLMANVIESAFEATNDLQSTIIACRKLVKYFKKSNLQHLLCTSLKYYCPTRWNTHFNLFQSISENWNEIKDVLADRSEVNRISEINVDHINALVELCKDFDLISKKLQTTSSPSICFVVLSTKRFEKKCEITARDTAPIVSLKNNLKAELHKKWIPNIDMLHKIACFLYPPAKNMQPEINSIIDSIIADMSNFQMGPSLQLNAAINTDFQVVPSAEIMDVQFFCPDILRPEEEEQECMSSEVHRYSQERVKIEDNFNVLSWWNSRRNDYKKLSIYALRVLSIPASSAASERVFSLAGNVITEKRNRIAPNSVDNILFLNSIFKENT